jgi:hypothetical protein
MASCCNGSFPLASALLALWSTIDAGKCEYIRVATYQDSINDQRRARLVLGKHGELIKNAYGVAGEPW